MIPAILSDTVDVLRRADSPAVDVLNNPNYGDPSSWNSVYTGIKVRLAWSGKGMQIKNTGELIYPTGVGYIPKQYTIKPMDRIITKKTPGNTIGIEYVVEAVYPSYILHGVVDHYEINLHLPL